MAFSSIFNKGSVEFFLRACFQSQTYVTKTFCVAEEFRITDLFHLIEYPTYQRGKGHSVEQEITLGKELMIQERLIQMIDQTIKQMDQIDVE